MNTPDDLSLYHAELLDGIYDCVDRIVLNAFFPLGQTGGGMRSWWRSLHGDDSQLDDKHLREMARDFRSGDDCTGVLSVITTVVGNDRSVTVLRSAKTVIANSGLEGGQRGLRGGRAYGT